MRKLVIAAMMIMMPPAAAYPQDDKGPPTIRTDRQIKEDSAIDKAYQQSVKGTHGDAKGAKIDPWQTVRPAGDSTKR